MLPQKHRLSLKTELKKIKEKGTLIQGRLFSLLVSPSNKNQPSRFGFIISTKIHKKAVKRNRAKRLLSEAIIELIEGIKPGYDVVILAKKKIIEADFKAIKEEMRYLLAKAGMVS